jgi:DNA-binding transcriptional MerR regulator
MKQQWKVGEIAKLTGLTIRTLRYYDQIGLYSPSGHSDSGHRLYTESDISRLQQIQSLKELALSLEEIKSVLAGDQYSPFEVISLQIARLKETITIQQKLLKELENVSSLMQTKKLLTLEDFTKLLGVMKMTHEKHFAQKRASWESNLDRLGSYLTEHSEEFNLGSDPS